jgi:hypothetical protein
MVARAPCPNRSAQGLCQNTYRAYPWNTSTSPPKDHRRFVPLQSRLPFSLHRESQSQLVSVKKKRIDRAFLANLFATSFFHAYPLNISQFFDDKHKSFLVITHATQDEHHLWY